MVHTHAFMRIFSCHLNSAGDILFIWQLWDLIDQAFFWQTFLCEPGIIFILLSERKREGIEQGNDLMYYRPSLLRQQNVLGFLRFSVRLNSTFLGTFSGRKHHWMDLCRSLSRSVRNCSLNHLDTFYRPYTAFLSWKHFIYTFLCQLVAVENAIFILPNRRQVAWSLRCSSAVRHMIERHFTSHRWKEQ